MNTSGKGSRVERIIQKFLEERGYTVKKARMSFGAFDLYAKGIFDGREKIRFIQSKANQWRCSASYLAELRAVDLPAGATREVWMHVDHSRVPGHGDHCMRARLILDERLIEIDIASMVPLRAQDVDYGGFSI